MQLKERGGLVTIQEYNDIYKNTVIKKMTIACSGGLVIRNSNIAQENMSLEESLCSEQNLKFGCCESSCFKVRLLECNHSFLGEWLDVKQTIYTDEDGYLLLEDGGYLLTEDGFRLQLETADAFSHYGKFKVYSDKPTNDRMWRDLVCYDAMYDILNADMLPWYKTLTFPMTLKALRDSFFDYLQIPQQTTTLVNDNFQTEGGFLVDGQLSGKTIINAICELNGVFGHISHNGVFEYISLPSADTIALDWYYDGTGAYEGYVVENITGVRAIGSDTDAGTSVGTTDNVYIVNNNPLIYGTEGTPELETALTNLLNAIKDITYRPFNVTTYGNPMLPLGTNLVINTRDQVINSFVMSRKLNGIQALKDTYKAVGDEKQPSDVNSLQSQIIRSRGKTHEMEVDVNQLKSTINNPETGVLSVLEQTVSRIVMKVDDNGNIVQVQLGKDPDDESATQFKVEADNIGFFADNMMQFTAKNIGIEADNFSVTPQGHLKSQSGDIGCMHVDGTNLYVYEYNINLLPTDSDEENRHYYESQALISVIDPGIPGNYLYYQVLLRAYYDELYDALYYKYKYIGPVEQDDPWAVSWDDETLTEYELFYYYGDYWSFPHQQPPVDVKYRLYYDPQDDTIKPFIVIPELSPSKYYFKSGSYYNGKQPSQTTAVWNTDYDGSGTDLSTYSCYYGGEVGHITENVIMTKISQYIEDFKDDVSFNTDPIVTITREGIEAVMGKIGGFKITENSLYNEKNSLTDLLNEGVYIGTDGIALGKGNFKVTKAGALTSKSGSIGGFTIDSTSIRSAALTSNASGSVGLSTTDFTRTINSVSRTNLRFAIGGAFGVKNDGTLYCSGAVINGSIRATSLTANDTIKMYSSTTNSDFKFMDATDTSAGYPIVKLFSPRTGSYLMSFGNDGTYPIYCPSGVSMYVSGEVAANYFRTISSKLVKENIKAIDDEKAKKLLELNVVDFDYIEGKGKKGQTGLIAEDVLPIIPNVVGVPDGYNETEVKEKLANGEEVVATMSIDYTKLVPYLIKMVQIQQKEIDELKAEIKAMKEGKNNDN